MVQPIVSRLRSQLRLLLNPEGVRQQGRRQIACGGTRSGWGMGLVLLAAAVTSGCSPSPSTPPATETIEGAAESRAVVAEPRRAEVGVGRQGRSLDDETGVGRAIAQPAVTLFAVRERAVFDIQIPQAMQLFEATEGHKPKSHEEFMQRIINANQIRLPELPAGSVYRYDPEKGELWVYPQE